MKAPGMPVFAEGLKVRAAQRHNDAGMAGTGLCFRQLHPAGRVEKTEIKWTKSFPLRAVRLQRGGFFVSP